MGIERWCRAGLLVVIASATACGDDDGVEPEARNALAELVVEGNGQSQVTGRFLRERIRVSGLLDDGSEGFHGRIYFEILSGDGLISMEGTTASGPGAVIDKVTVSGRVLMDWRVGTPGIPQQVRAFALRSATDTVEALLEATAIPEEPLERLEVTGNGQSAPQGELLRDTIEVQALMTNGWPALGVIQIAILEGDGLVDLDGIRGRGPGTTLGRSTDDDGRIRFTWIMGTAGLDHRVRAYMVGEVDDTVSFDITATSLPPGGAAGLRP